MSYAKAELETLYGKLVSSWKREGGSFEYTVTIPPNTSATIRLPYDGRIFLNGAAVVGTVHELTSGTYCFNVSQ